ncbi:sensor histidine kinase [Amnibacterium setariae]|nr:histidine kinase [Amnibacterium setariae]
MSAPADRAASADRVDRGGRAAVDTATTDRIYAGVAAIAAALALVESPRPPWAIALILLALAPWVAVVLRREPPAWLFVALAVLPVVPVVLAADVGVVVFMTTAAASRFASRTDDLRLVVGVTVAVALIPFLPGLVVGRQPNGGGYFAFGDVFGVLVGVLLRRTNRLAARLREADADLAAARVRDERQRIARDVHDLVAHSLTVVVLHVGGARRVLRIDPAAAESALADAERVCRESLDGIRGVVGLLSEQDPRPGVSLDLGELVDAYRAAGVAVALHVDGDPAALPLAARVVLFRVVQEALANAARYAPPGSTVEVAVAAGAEEASARVANPRGPARAPSAGGFGLAGLREQVAAVGGALTSGPAGERWVVEGRLPLRAAVAGA